MAEESILWTTSGIGDGDGGGYTSAQLTAAFRGLFSPTANLGGVAPYALNKLEVSGSSSPVSVDSGVAIVYGFIYVNTAAVNVTISTPAGATRIDRIVLRADWTAQTVRITRIAGTEGGGVPALTQSAGATWDIPLAQVSITTGGVITITDEREWLTVVGDGMVTTAKLADDAVTFAKMQNVTSDRLIGRDTASSGDPEEITVSGGLEWTGSGGIRRSALTGDVTASAGSNTTTIANNAVTNAKLRDSAALSVIGRSANSSGDPADISAGTDGHVLRRSGTTLGFGTVATAGIADGAVTQAKLGADTLRMMVIPIAMGINDFQTTSTSYTDILNDTIFELDDSKLPAGCTVKLGVAAYTASGTGNTMVRMVNLDSSTQVVEVTGVSNDIVYSADIKSSLAGTNARYRLQLKAPSTGTASFQRAYLLVEW